MLRELDQHGERLVILVTEHRFQHPSGRNKSSGSFKKPTDKLLINSNTLSKHLMQVVTQKATDAIRIVLTSKEKKQSEAAPPDPSTELHQSLSSCSMIWLHVKPGMLLRNLLGGLSIMQDLHSNLDPGVFTGWIQQRPDPVSPQKEPLCRSHHRAAESVGEVQLEAALDVRH